jgi:glucokinase
LLSADARIVLTLDAGGSSFRFAAVQGGRIIAQLPPAPSHAADLKACLEAVCAGFAQVAARCAEPPVAISFAFPGPADYPAGIVGDLPNFPAFRGGVALGPMLQDRFRLPVYLNNDGDLFAHGEALAGFLPWINERLASAGSPKLFSHLLGVTLGTGLGGGMARGGELMGGDNSSAANVHLLRNKLDWETNAEEGACIRAVRRSYAQLAEISLEQCPDPAAIARIARGEAAGHRAAAVEAYRQLGEVAGDALCQAAVLWDGLVVIGGGLSGAADLFLPALLQVMNSRFTGGAQLRRLGPRAFNAEDPAELAQFLAGDVREITVPGSERRIRYDALSRTAVGMTRLGTTNAIALGAYAFALRKLDSKA